MHFHGYVYVHVVFKTFQYNLHVIELELGVALYNIHSPIINIK